MFLSHKVVALVTLCVIGLSIAQEDRPTSRTACAKDRCVPVRLKPLGDDSVWGARPAAAANEVVFTYKAVLSTPAVATETLFDYDKYFDFDSYDVMCNTCYTSIPKAAITSVAQPVAYVRNDQNCRTTPAVGAEMTIKRRTGAVVPDLVTNQVDYRIMTAAFFQDKTAVTSDPSAGGNGYCNFAFQGFTDPCCLESLAPSTKPTLPPTTRAPTTPAPSKNPCFSSVSTVDVKGKGQTTMKELQVGDIVLTPKGYEKVFTIDHREENTPTEFVQIDTQLGNTLEMTSKHLIYIHGKHDPIEAGRITVGDKLQGFSGTSMDSVVVTKVGTITRNGLYNPITSSGSIVVNGIATSTYTAVDITDGSDYLNVGGFRVISMHDFMHLAIGPFKTLCLNIPDFASQGMCSVSGEGHNVYNKMGLWLISFGKQQTAPIQNLIIVSLLSMFAIFSLCSNPIFVLVASVYASKNLKRTKM